MRILKTLICMSLVLLSFTGEGKEAPSKDGLTAYVNEGNAQAKKGNYSKALAALNTAIQKNPQSARAYKIRGHVYYAMGNHTKALTDLDHVVSLVPDSANAYVDRSIVESVMGKHGLALADIERALALKPSSPFAKEVRKEILERAKS